MKNLLTNPVIVNVEATLIEDVVKLLLNAIHPRVPHNEVQTTVNRLGQAYNEAHSKNADTVSV